MLEKFYNYTYLLKILLVLASLVPISLFFIELEYARPDLGNVSIFPYRSMLIIALYALVFFFLYLRGDVGQTLRTIKDTLILSILVFAFINIPLLLAKYASVIPSNTDSYIFLITNLTASICVISLVYFVRLVSGALAKLALAFLTAVVVIINCAYICIFYITGFEFGPTVLLHVGFTAALVAVKEYTSIIVALLFTLVIYFFLFHKYFIKEMSFRSGSFTISICLLAFFTNVVFYDDLISANLKGAIPSYAFYNSIKAHDLGGPESALDTYSSLRVLDSEKNVLRQYGISDENPHQQPIPPKRRHNIILIYLESFQNSLTKKGGWKGKPILPVVDSLADKFSTFNNYYNSETPTMNAIVSSQCGVDIQYNADPIMHNKKWIKELLDNQSSDAIAYNEKSLLCLSDVLHEYGYAQVFMKGADINFSNTKSFFSDHGYDELLGRDELSKEKHQERLNLWGLQDIDLFEEALVKLDELERKQPFNLTLLTVNSHAPGYEDPRCPAYKEGDEQLNGFHCTDFALGKFMTALFDRKIIKNTYVVIAGDHTLTRAPSLIGAYKDKLKFSWYGNTYFAAYSPYDDLPSDINTVGYTPDFAATVLDLLGFENVWFINGKSLLGERRNYQHLVAQTYELVDGVMSPNSNPPRRNECSQSEMKNTTISGASGKFSECEKAKIHGAQMKLIYEGAL